MQTLSEIRALLAERGLRPRHRLGQNFLHDKNQILRLVAAADVALGDRILEVGPGTGTLTEALLDRGAELVARRPRRVPAQLATGLLGRLAWVLDTEPIPWAAEAGDGGSTLVWGRSTPDVTARAEFVR